MWWSFNRVLHPFNRACNSDMSICDSANLCCSLMKVLSCHRSYDLIPILYQHRIKQPLGKIPSRPSPGVPIFGLSWQWFEPVINYFWLPVNTILLLQIGKTADVYAATEKVRQLFQIHGSQSTQGYAQDAAQLQSPKTPTCDITLINSVVDANKPELKDNEQCSGISNVGDETMSASNLNTSSPSGSFSSTHDLKTHSSHSGFTIPSYQRQQYDKRRKMYNFASKSSIERKPTDHKLSYSVEHKNRMKMNVFDRLTKAKWDNTINDYLCIKKFKLHGSQHF